MTLPTTVAPTIGKLIPRLASEHDGEVVATARAIERLLKSYGSDLHDLAATICPPSAQLLTCDWRRDVRFCVANSKRLSIHEFDFLTSLARWRGQPTEKQLNWLGCIADRLRRAAA